MAACTWTCNASSSSRTSHTNMRLSNFFNNRRKHLSFGGEVQILSHPCSLRGRRSSAVARKLLSASGISICAYLSPQTHIPEFCYIVPGGSDFRFRLDACGSGASCGIAQFPGHVTGCTGKVAPSTYLLLRSGC
jgi:hypothetical protein